MGADGAVSGVPFGVDGEIVPWESGFGNANPFDNEKFVLDFVKLITNTVAENVVRAQKSQLTAILSYGEVDRSGVYYSINYPSIIIDGENRDVLEERIKLAVTTSRFNGDKMKFSMFVYEPTTVGADEMTFLAVPRPDSISTELVSEDVNEFLRAYDNPNIVDAINRGLYHDSAPASKKFELKSASKDNGESSSEKLKQKMEQKNPMGYSDVDISSKKDRKMSINIFLSNLRTSGKKIAYIDEKAYMYELLEMMEEVGMFGKDLPIYRTVGEVFYRVNEGSPVGLIEWTEFGKQHEQDTSKYQLAYSDMFGSHTSIITLFEMLMESAFGEGEEKAAEWQRDKVEAHLDSCYKFDSYNMATVVQMLRFYDYIFDDTSSLWYFYEGGVWSTDPCKLRLRNYFTEKLKHVMLDYYTVTAADTEGEDEVRNKRLKAIQNAIDGTVKSTAISGVIGELQTRLNIRSVDTKLNKKYHTFHCANGVLEFIEETKDVIFRAFRREDYAEFKSPVAYDPSFNWDHPDVVYGMRYYSMVFPDVATRDCRLRWDGSKFYRGNSHNKAVAECIGNHNNSKSVETFILCCIFGPYAVKGKMSLLTNDPQESGSVDTSINGAEDKATWIFEEPERGAVIKNTGIIKQTSGDDTRPARRMKQEERNIKIPAKIEIITNFHVGPAPGDDAFEGRALYFPYVSLWSKDAPDDPELQEKYHHYKIDPDFRNKIKRLLPAFLWIYIEYAKMWFKDNKNLRVSEQMLKVAKEFEAQSDFYTPYLESRYEKVDDGRVDYNTFIKNADETLSVSKYRSIYHSDVLEKYLKKWLGKSDYITIGDDGKKYIVGISALSAER